MSQAVLDAVRDLLPTFRERADETERLRVVPESSIKELADTGFFRLLQPKRFDGFEADPVTFYTAVRDIASACGSTGWVSSVVGVHPWQVALFADEAQQAVWGSDTSTRLSSSYAPTGKATRVDGGYRLSGRWSFSSGCDHCAWVLLGALVFDGEGNVVDFKTFLVPRRELRDPRRVAHRRPARHRLQRHRRRRRVRARGVHAVDGGDRALPRSRPGAEHRRPLQAPLPLGLHLHDHHPDRRHGARRLRRARRDAEEARARVVRRGEGSPSTRSRRSAWRGPPPTSTPPGRC